MLNLSIMPLDLEHIDEVCEDVISQQQSGATTCAMFMMKFNPECTPPVNKAELQCKKYDAFRARLDRANAKHGVLVQATLGHITVPSEPYPYQPSVSLITGEERVVTACPLDPGFRQYIKGQMRILAGSNPSIVMLDDDLGLLYKPTLGCACKYHMAEFNRRAGTEMSREELYRHTQSKEEESKRYTGIYIDVVRDSLVGAISAMREGLDEVNPKIQGIVSGIYTSAFCEFSGEAAEAFAGCGNPRIIRLNGGPYAKLGTKFFTSNIWRAAILRENVKDKVDIFLAETDTCPQNRYSTSAAHLHLHYTASILEGAKGAKHWITRLAAHEPSSGIAYRKKLAKYRGFYESLSKYADLLSPFGCKIPLTLKQNYGFVPTEISMNLCPWASCVLERFGLPLYFGNHGDGAVFLDEFSVDGFSDAEIEGFLSGTLVLTAHAADKLVARGFKDMIGVTVSDWSGVTITAEIDRKSKNKLSVQYDVQKLSPCREGVEVLTDVVHINTATDEQIPLFPGVTYYENSLGGAVIVYSGTVDMPYKYFTAFSMLNETRKAQLADLLSRRKKLPVYYQSDAEVYTRAGFLPTGELLVALFNLGFDELDGIRLCCKQKVTKVELLDADGKRVESKFDVAGDTLCIHASIPAVTPAVFILS